MTTKSDRKVKGNKPTDTADNQTAFTLPDSLPCSEVDFPILITSNKPGLAYWNEIIEESDKEMKELEAYVQSKSEPIIPYCFIDTESDYIRDQVFVHLIPALEETLNKAQLWEALQTQKCFFNGIDHIVQLLWNNNPRHPERKLNNLHLFNMPWVRITLGIRPRPFYPKSWLWTEDYAATMIQKTVRRYFVQRLDEVQEMREFWRKLIIERNLPDLKTNPFLAKKFAAEPRETVPKH